MNWLLISILHWSDSNQLRNQGGLLKTILFCAITMTWVLASPSGHAQLAIDTVHFARPVLIDGAIPGLYKWANSPQSDSAVLTVLSPVDGQQYKPGDSVFVTFSVAGIAIGAQTQHADLLGLANSAEGQHVHVILDNQEPITSHSVGRPIFAGTVERGFHTLRVFACRSWHESIKSPDAYQIISIVADLDTSILRGQSPRQDVPLLTHSQPAGEYVGEESGLILIDFLLSNAVLGADEHKVRLTIDSSATDLVDWVPYLITGLGPGEHTVKLELLSDDNQPTGGSFNATERKIVVK